jgi:hypothetical protein
MKAFAAGAAKTAGTRRSEGSLLMARKWWTLTAVVAGVFMLLLDVTIVNVALPQTKTSPRASPSSSASTRREARSPAARRARAAWWPAAHPVQQPGTGPPQAAQPSVTCTLSASSDAPRRCWMDAS